MTDLEKALAKIEEGAGQLREFDKCVAREIEELCQEVRADMQRALDDPKGIAA